MSSEKKARPGFGSIELEVKLVTDTLLIDDERANIRALNMVANSVFRPSFRAIVMSDLLFMPLVSRLQPPAIGLIQYRNKYQMPLRKMKAGLQPLVNAAAARAMTCLLSSLGDAGRCTLIAADCVAQLMLLYELTENASARTEAEGALKILGISLGHKAPMYPHLVEEMHSMNKAEADKIRMAGM